MAMSGLEALFGALGRLAGLEAELPAEAETIAHEMADAMRNEIGTYQPGWPQLAAATQAERVRLGYTANDPLLREGTLQDAITAWPEEGDSSSWNAGIPADDPMAPIGFAQEFGSITPNGALLPSRPFVGPIAQDYGARAVDGLAAKVEQAL